MKKTKIALFALTAMLASCSSDDGERTDGRVPRRLTIAGVPMTRATLTEGDGSSLGAAWEAGDAATYFNVSSFKSDVMDCGTLMATGPGRTSAFSGTVCCSAGDAVALFYPQQEMATTGAYRGGFTLSLGGQKGTLTDIARRYHYVYGVAKVTSVTGGTAHATISNMEPLLSVCRFAFVDKASDADAPRTIAVKSLAIELFDNNFSSAIGYPQSATLSPTLATGTPALEYAGQDAWEPLSVTLDAETDGGVYVALFPYSPTGYMRFTVTNSSGTYTGTAKATLEAGGYYNVRLKVGSINSR